MIRQGRGKEPAGLRLFPKGDKYGQSDSIIRSSRIVCGAYAFAPYVGGCAPRPHLLCLSPVGDIWGAYAFAPYKRGFASRPLSPFLSLMKEKEAKENQGVRDASQICRVPAGDVRDTDPIRHIRPIFLGLGRGLDLLLPSFLLSREEKKVPAGLRLSPVGAICGAYAFAPYKRGSAPTPPVGAAYVLRPLTVLCDPLYKCAGRLRVLTGWGRGVMGCVWGLNDLHIIY